MTEKEIAEVWRDRVLGMVWNTIEGWKREEQSSEYPENMPPDFSLMESDLQGQQELIRLVIRRLDELEFYTERDEETMRLLLKECWRRKRWIEGYRAKYNTGKP